MFSCIDCETFLMCVIWPNKVSVVHVSAGFLTDWKNLSQVSTCFHHAIVTTDGSIFYDFVVCFMHVFAISYFCIVVKDPSMYAFLRIWVPYS